MSLTGPYPNPINGTWHLKHARGRLQRLDNINDSRGQVSWTFNGNLNLIIENNIMRIGTEVHAGFATGTYPYQVQVSDDTTFLFLGNQQLETNHDLNNILLIDQGNGCRWIYEDTREKT